MLNFFRHFLQTKGPGHGLERFLEVVWRFTRGGRRLDHIIDLVEKTLGSHQVRITFFVSAGVIGRHRSRIERLKRLGHEIGSHGVYHSRMDLLDRSRQLHVLEESQILLERAGFDPQGFRSPYLSYDQGTREALESSRFLWTSGR
ncbi:MAG: polysaccharide deacetylase family protein, partial [Acidobacteriota bacterium]